jgi:hypothetical protein
MNVGPCLVISKCLKFCNDPIRVETWSLFLTLMYAVLKHSFRFGISKNLQVTNLSASDAFDGHSELLVGFIVGFFVGFIVGSLVGFIVGFLLDS